MSIILTVDESKGKINTDMGLESCRLSTAGFGQRSSIALSLYLAQVCLAKR